MAGWPYPPPEEQPIQAFPRENLPPRYSIERHLDKFYCYRRTSGFIIDRQGRVSVLHESHMLATPDNFVLALNTYDDAVKAVYAHHATLKHPLSYR